VAAGGDRYGYWYAYTIDGTPFGPSQAIVVKECKDWNNGLSVEKFDDNVAHSNFSHGLRIFHALVPRTHPCKDPAKLSEVDPWAANPPIPGNYNRFTAYRNGMVGAVTEKTGDIRFNDFKLVDNKDAAIEMTYTQDSKPFASVGVFGALIVGKSADNTETMDGAMGIITA
jgi:hypothetical protein